MTYDDMIEQLARDYPDLFEKSGNFEMSIGVGWYNIIDLLCNFISSGVTQARQRIKYAQENPESKFVKPMEELEKELASAIEELPTLAQVKEKFGGLRFYVDGGTREMGNYIDFAEAMSYRTCDVCGDAGKSRNDGWIRTLCDKHYQEKNPKSVKEGKVSPNLFDDE